MGNRLNLPSRILYNDNKGWESKNGAFGSCKNADNHCWFFPEAYFWGKFNVTFTIKNCNKKIEHQLRDNLLLPLLNFIQKYAFIGGKNNIGFGRVRIVDYPQREYCPLEDSIQGIKFNDLVDDNTPSINNIDVFRNLLEVDKPDNTKGMADKTFDGIIDTISKKIRTTSNVNTDTAYLEVLKSLLETRVSLRKQIRFDNSLDQKYKDLVIKKIREKILNGNDKKEYIELHNWHKLRHRVFGSTQEKDAEAAKIIPLITRTNGQYNGSLISYAGILSMKETMKGGE